MQFVGIDKAGMLRLAFPGGLHGFIYGMAAGQQMPNTKQGSRSLRRLRMRSRFSVAVECIWDALGLHWRGHHHQAKYFWAIAWAALRYDRWVR